MAALAAALVALLAVLAVAHPVAVAQSVANRTSAVRQLRGSSSEGGWLAAKATWYGAPNGAGPDDNGTHKRQYLPRARALHACVALRLRRRLTRTSINVCL